MKVFGELQPLCDRLMTEPNAQNVALLADRIERYSDAAIKYSVEYIFMRIRICLVSGNLSKDVTQQLVQLLGVVISKTRITSQSDFEKLNTALLFQIYEPSQEFMLIPDHEELKEDIVKCLNILVKRCSSDLIESLYVAGNAPKLGQSVYTCLSIARTEKLCSLRVAALETLMTLSQVHDDADSNDITLRAQVADVIMFFLPGIASGLGEIALGSELQNHRITVMAIRAYGRILSLVMEDTAETEDLTIDSVRSIGNVEESSDPLGMRLKLEGVKGMRKYIATAKRSPQWLDSASTKLNGSMQSLTNLVRHPHFKVRRELVLAVKLMLSRCSRNLKKNLTVLVDILISLSEDTEDQVRDLATATLNDDVNVKLTRNHGMRPVVEILEENFYKLLTKLPRFIRRSDDTMQLFYLNQLAGYIRLLGKGRLPHVMASSSHLKRLVLALVYVAELDCSHVTVLEDVQIKDIQDSTCGNLNSFKCFKFIRETRTEEKLTSVCRLLGESGDPVLLADCIFDLMSEIPQYRKELTLLLNWIATVPVQNPATSNLHKQINDYYTDPANWYLPIRVDENVTLGDAQSNVVHCCLLTEGLGIVATNLREEYQKYLLKTLYLVIERAGSGNSSLSQSGLKCLEAIARSQSYTNVADLLRDNVDYVSYHMTMKMRRVERNPGVLDVFAVVMKYSTMELLPCPREVVEVALAQLSADSRQRNSHDLLKILHVFVMCVRKMTEGTERGDTEEQRDNAETTPNVAEIVIQSVLDYRNAKRDSERLDDDIVTTPGDIETELDDGTAEQFSDKNDEQDEEKKPPSYVKMTESVIRCCLNFLPSKEVPKSLLAMQIMEEGLCILSTWSEQLLPIVHELWHPLVGRFDDSNVLVINRAWRLLCTLARVSQDFIRSRTLKQVLPSLSQFLIKSAKESYKKDSKSAYDFTQIFKLQKMILTEAAALARNLKLHERQVWQMLDIAQPYLSARQHPALQECCVQLFKDVARFQADVVWVKCLSAWNYHIAPIPADSKLTLGHLKETSTSGAHSDYRRNIERVLTTVEELSAFYV